jgi:hypothetical protein
MNLAARVYRYLKERYPNQWQRQEAIIALSKTIGYGREETIGTLDDMSKGTPAHAKIIERINHRKQKSIEYRWTEESDLELIRKRQIAWFDSYKCQCGIEGCKH